MYSFCVSMPKKNVYIYIYAWHHLSTLLHYCQSFLKICLKIIIHYCKYTANTSKSNNNTFFWGGTMYTFIYNIYIYTLYIHYIWHIQYGIYHIYRMYHIYHIYHTSYIHAYHIYIYIYSIIYVYNTYITGSVFVDQNCFVRKRPFCAGGMLQ